MRLIIPTAGGSLLLAAAWLSFSSTASALPASFAAATAPQKNAARIHVGHRRYGWPSEPARIYRVPALPPPVVEYRRPLPYPPLTVYDPPLYGWDVPPWGAPPSPASCGKLRRWDGTGCGETLFYPR